MMSYQVVFSSEIRRRYQDLVTEARLQGVEGSLESAFQQLEEEL